MCRLWRECARRILRTRQRLAWVSALEPGPPGGHTLVQALARELEVGPRALRGPFPPSSPPGPGSCLAARGGVGTGLALPARPRLASSCRGCTCCPRPCSTSPTRRRSAGTRSATSTRKVPAGRGADGAAGGGGTAAGRALSLNVEGNAARLAAEPRGSAAVYPVLLAGRGSCAGNSRGMRKEWLRALVLSGLQQLPSYSLRRFCFLFNSQKKKQ